MAPVQPPAMQFLDVDTESIRRFAVGDVLAILSFVVIGEFSHGANPLADPTGALDAALPFLIGWAIVAPLAGAYAEKTRGSVKAAVVPALVAWLGADLVGQGLRATAVFGGNAAVTFFLVALAFGGLLLTAWRAVAVRLLEG